METTLHPYYSILVKGEMILQQLGLPLDLEPWSQEVGDRSATFVPPQAALPLYSAATSARTVPLAINAALTRPCALNSMATFLRATRAGTGDSVCMVPAS
jgi:hypothetical protein